MPELELPIDSCPLCGLNGISSIPFLGFTRSRQYTCVNCGTYNMHYMAYRFTPIITDSEIRAKLSYYIRNNSPASDPILIHKNNYTSILKMVTLPSTLEQMENFLLWFGETSNNSFNDVKGNHLHLPALIGCKSPNEILQLLEAISDEGYIKITFPTLEALRLRSIFKSFNARLTPKGITKIEEIRKTNSPKVFNISEISVDSILNQNESFQVEVKSSLKLDINRLLKGDHKKELDNRLAKENVLKEIVAFLNTQGGSILIGVIEKSNFSEEQVNFIHYKSFGNFYIIGILIENDNTDKYEQTVRNLINEHISKELVELITITFPEFSGFTFCKINIHQASHKWYYLDEEKFFVRNGNRTDILIGTDADNYKKRNPR